MKEKLKMVNWFIPRELHIMMDTFVIMVNQSRALYIIEDNVSLSGEVFFYSVLECAVIELGAVTDLLAIVLYYDAFIYTLLQVKHIT